MSGWLFLGISTAISIGVFLNGLRFSRMASNPFVGQKLFGMPVGGSELSIGDLRRFGRLQMAIAPVVWIFFAALSLGFLGPVNGIDTIM